MHHQTGKRRHVPQANDAHHKIAEPIVTSNLF